MNIQIFKLNLLCLCSAYTWHRNTGFCTRPKNEGEKCWLKSTPLFCNRTDERATGDDDDDDDDANSRRVD